jgi:hypothetical protein
VQPSNNAGIGYETLDQATQSPQQPVAAHSGNWLTHLLPSGGALAGGAGGAALGTAILPGIGTIAGGILGAALGGGDAKAAENAIEHQNLGNGVASTALESGAGQALGMGVGAGLGKIAGAVGGKAAGVADNLLKGQFAKGALTGEDANVLRTAGITDARQLPQVANVITGDTGALHQGVLRGLTESDVPADFSNLSQTGKNLVSANQMQLKQSSIPQINDVIQGALIKSVTPEDVTQMGVGGGKSPVVNAFEPGALKNVTADRAFDVTKNFEALAAAARNSAYDKMGNVVDADQLAKAKIFGGLADEARTATFGTETPVPLSDTNKAQIINELAPLKDINPNLHSTVVNQVNNANTLQDLRGIQAPFVRGSQAATATAKAADRGAGTTAGAVANNLAIPGAIAGGPPGMLAGLGAQLLRSPAADRVAIPLAEKGGALLSKIGGSNAPSILGGATGALAGTSNNIIQNSGTVGGNMQPTAEQLSGQPTPITQQLPAPQGQGLSREDLLTLAMYSPGALSALTPNAAQTGNVTNAQSAEQALHTLAGNAPSGGLVSQLQGKLGVGGTGEYQREAQSAAQQVANALPGSDAKAIEKELTDYAAGGGNINNAIQSLLQRLQSVVQSNQNTGVGGALGLNAATPQTITAQLPVSAY